MVCIYLENLIGLVTYNISQIYLYNCEFYGDENELNDST